VVAAYGNTDEGDQSSGLDRSGPAAADRIGTVEAHAFMRAWRAAGRHLERSPTLARRWTRMCWCGQQTAQGPVSDTAVFGEAEFTGSEEGRGPLFDVTRVPFEGDHLPAGVGTQGDKIQAPIPLDVPKAVPLMALRIGDRMIVSVPGEMTDDMGRRVRAAVAKASAGAGIADVVISGLANEYADYFTTPEEYDAQHYEGAATIYGRASSVALQQVLVGLADDLVAGRPAPAPYPYDPVNGIGADASAAPFPSGPSSASVRAQPDATAPRLGHPTFSWEGGQRAYERPLDRAFVLVQRQAGGGWTTVDDDLGLNILWTVDDGGIYRAKWEVPLSEPAGSYRFVVEANHYGLTSAPFRVVPSQGLTATRAGRAAITLDYPRAISHEDVGEPAGDSTADLTARPDHASSGKTTFLVNGQPKTVRADQNGAFNVAAPPGAQIEVPPGAAKDQYGNANANDLQFTA
jgi:hypothetical protein